jgi:hypothetical protein
LGLVDLACLDVDENEVVVKRGNKSKTWTKFNILTAEARASSMFLAHSLLATTSITHSFIVLH